MINKNEIAELIRSYPENYSIKELIACLWAELGLIVSEDDVLLALRGNQ